MIPRTGKVTPESATYCCSTSAIPPAVVIASLIAIPLGIVIGHTGRGSFLLIGVGNAARAIPSLGLLVLIVLLLGTGNGPIVGVLAVLAVPPILTSTATGIRGADHEAVHAARALGMSGGQVIRNVEWPLALPLVISVGAQRCRSWPRRRSPRTAPALASVGWSRGTRTVTTPKCLPAPLSSLCWRSSWTWRWSHRLAERATAACTQPDSWWSSRCVDITWSDGRDIPGVQMESTMKIKSSVIGAGLGIAALLLTACGGGNDPLAESSAEPSEAASSPTGGEILVGSADFTESKILAEIYSQALQAKGVQSSTAGDRISGDLHQGAAGPVHLGGAQNTETCCSTSTRMPPPPRPKKSRKLCQKRCRAGSRCSNPRRLSIRTCTS